MRILTTLFLLGAFAASGQVFIDSNRQYKHLDSIKFTNTVPEGIANGKSIVIHTGNIKNFKRNAELLQPGLKNAGVDAVAHHYFEDIFSGTEAITAYTEQLSTREIQNLIYYQVTDSAHRLIFMPFDGKEFFQSPAYMIEHPQMKGLFNSLYLQVARSGHKILNLLILDVPAYPEYPRLIKGRRAEFYDLNMKSGKVAIERTPDSLLNKSIDSVMAAHYPYDYGFVDPGLSAAELRKDGYWFILYGVHGPGKTIKKLLDYPINEDETAYASIVADGNETDVKTIAIEDSVYKFYIKDVQKGDVFLGKHYDADERWETALKNYILNLRNILDR